MKGTFKPGDRLAIETIPYERIQKGDLVIFSMKGGDEDDFIVHRVVDLAANGLVTRGDNCRARDRDPVSMEKIVGRVTRYDRRGKTRKAWSGWPGRLRAMMLHGRVQAFGAVKLIFRKPYRIIRATGLLAGFWHPEIEALLFESPHGPLEKYVHKEKTVGTCRIGKNRCWIRRPYDLIIWPALERKSAARAAAVAERRPPAQL